jgi:hypothetical protein
MEFLFVSSIPSLFHAFVDESYHTICQWTGCHGEETSHHTQQRPLTQNVFPIRLAAKKAITKPDEETKTISRVSLD